PERFGAPRTLHPFPTRRSSDLTTSSTATWPKTWACSSVEAVEGRLDRARGARREPGAVRADARSQAEPAGADRPRLLSAHRARQDRKSTRLNSSHECTSYAVFC